MWYYTYLPPSHASSPTNRDFLIEANSIHIKYWLTLTFISLLFRFYMLDMTPWSYVHI
jgi:hypothetical protein